MAHVADPLTEGARLALCGGVAAYLAGHWAFGVRLGAPLTLAKPIAAAACLVVFAVAGGLPAWATAGMVAGVLAMLVVYETVNTRVPAAHR